IIVDAAGKAAARAEKEERAEGEKKAREQAAAKGGGQGGAEQLSFDDIVRMFAMQALTYLGAFPDPETGRAVLAPEVAKLHIDLLGILQEKTKGNLTKEEDEALTETVRELRQQFVLVMEAVRKAQAEGRIDPKTGMMSMGGGPGAPGAGPRPGPGMGGAFGG